MFIKFKNKNKQKTCKTSHIVNTAFFMCELAVNFYYFKWFVLLLILHFAGGLHLTGLLNLSYGNIILVLQSTVHITLALFFFLVKYV